MLDPEALQRAKLSFVLKGLEFHRGGPAGGQDGGLKLKTLLCGRDFLSVQVLRLLVQPTLIRHQYMRKAGLDPRNGRANTMSALLPSWSPGLPRPPHIPWAQTTRNEPGNPMTPRPWPGLTLLPGTPSSSPTSLLHLSNSTPTA